MNDERPEILNDPIGTLRRRWTTVWKAAVVAIAIGAAWVVFFVEPAYEATARVFVSSPQISEDFVPVVESGDPFERINAMIGKILAHPSLADLVDQHGLYKKALHKELLADVLDRMRDSVTIELDSEFKPITRSRDTARVFQIRFEYSDAESSAKVANALASRFVEENIRVRTEHARVTADFMQRELEQAERVLAEQNRLITALKQDARGELPDELDASLKRLERLQDQRQSLSLQIAQTEANLVVLSQGAADSGAVMSPEERLELLRSEIDAASSRFTASHPRLIDLRAQAKELEKTVADRREQGSQRPSLLTATRKTLRELQSQLEETRAEIVVLDERVKRMPERAEQLAELEQKAGVLRENYLEFERKAQDADLALRVELAQQGRQVVVLERATPPTTPVRSQFMYLGFVTLIGLCAGIGAAAYLENADPVMVSDEHLKPSLEVPILASIPPLR